MQFPVPDFGLDHYVSEPLIIIQGWIKKIVYPLNLYMDSYPTCMSGNGGGGGNKSTGCHGIYKTYMYTQLQLYANLIDNACFAGPQEGAGISLRVPPGSSLQLQ